MHRYVRVIRAALTRGALMLLVTGVATSCDRPATLEPAAAPVQAPAHAPVNTSLLGPITGIITGTLHGLLDCPADQSLSATATVGPDGGTLAVGGFRVDFPAGAVRGPETFTLDVPAGRYLEIDVHAASAEHYVFDAPVTVTLDASRCGLLPPGLQVWNIDTDSKALLEPMGTVLDLLSRTVRFRTSHFSGYTIAW